MTSGKTIMSVLAGVAAGALLGIALSPKKGSKAQKNLNKKGSDLADALNARIDERFEELLDQMESRFGKQTKQS
ncbi:MAG TPA: YtxH domain-containing protein [Cyclobacteriaceae bacterium]|nr:YtxH domain-containing protein [Cyclobacteriaceae bacterium]